MSTVPDRGRLRPSGTPVRLPLPPAPVPRVAPVGGPGRTWIPGVTSPAYAPQAGPVHRPADRDGSMVVAVRGAVSTLLLVSSLGFPVAVTAVGIRLAG